MVLSEEEAEEDDEPMEEVEMVAEGREMEAALNMNLVVRLNSPKTMKLVKQFKGRNVVVLIYSGATHNFVSDRVVDDSKISVSFTRFAVILGDNRKVRGLGRYEKVELILQGITFV